MEVAVELEPEIKDLGCLERTQDEVSSEHHTPPLIGKVIEITKPLYETVLPAEPTQDHRLRREPPSQHSPRPPPQEIALLPRRSIAVPAQGVTLSPQVSPPPPPQRTHVSARISPTAPHQSSFKEAITFTSSQKGYANVISEACHPSFTRPTRLQAGPSCGGAEFREQYVRASLQQTGNFFILC
ncbi:hypothetical protein COOONC_06404 [Cooperia oncophora]